MLNRLAGASVRAALVAIAVVIPALTLPGVSNHSAELAILLATLAATFVIVEYGFNAPSLVEFRFAAPYNRLRFLLLATLLVALTVLFRETIHQTGSTIVVSRTGAAAHAFWDFPGSPLRAFLALAHQMDPESRHLVGVAAAVALTITVAALGLFSWAIVAFSWPLARDNFNLWTNMPTIDAQDPETTVEHLRQSAFISVVIGLTLPYLAPQAALAFMGPLEAIGRDNSLFFVWMIAIWCFVPAVSLLRAIALYRVAHMLSREAGEA